MDFVDNSQPFDIHHTNFQRSCVLYIFKTKIFLKFDSKKGVTMDFFESGFFGFLVKFCIGNILIQKWTEPCSCRGRLLSHRMLFRPRRALCCNAGKYAMRYIVIVPPIKLPAYTSVYLISCTGVEHIKLTKLTH